MPMIAMMKIHIMVELIIDISNHGSGWPDNIENIVKKAALTTWQNSKLNRAGSELSVVLGDNNMVQDLNAKWRGIDHPTNILSFPANDDQANDGINNDISGMPILLGDLILALEIIKDEAYTQNKSFNDHLSHLIIHGLLHLQGHDHIKDDEADIMEALEIKLLAKLNIKNPYQ